MIARLLLLQFIAVSAFVFSLATVSKADDCDNCKSNVTKLATFLASPEVINATIESFNRDLCPYYTNETEACRKNVTLLWPSMASALFKNADVPEAACQGMNKCNKTNDVFLK